MQSEEISGTRGSTHTTCCVETFLGLIKKEGLQSVTKYLRLTLVFMRNSALREEFNRYFSGLFC